MIILILLDGNHVIGGSDPSDDSDNNPTWEITKNFHIEYDKGIV